MTLSLSSRRESANGGLARLRDEMDRAFERFVSEPWGLIEPKAMRDEGWFPPVDLSDSDKVVTIRTEVPGIAAKDLDISISGATLILSGQKEEKEEKEGENFYRSERRFGSFRRMIELPEGIDVDKVTAESDNGVVTITIAKKSGAAPKKVEVKPTSKKVSVAG